MASALLGEKQRSAQMFARIQAHRRARGHGEAEHMLGVVRDARRVAVAPDRIDLVDVDELPVVQAR
jgi:hypothetical protein